LTCTTSCRRVTTDYRDLIVKLRMTEMKQAPLANAELAVMDLLWRNDDPMTARQILEQLYPDAAKPQHGTVQRLLQRLEDKGFIERDRSLFVHLFSAAISRQTYAGQQLESLADKLTAGSFAPLITHLVEAKKISRDEINRIRAILDGQVDEGDQA
jgi:BlaI family penicillinase repressor